jgi:CRP/FNR family cyclic AMP-dependent transcriptional regulator
MKTAEIMRGPRWNGNEPFRSTRHDVNRHATMAPMSHEALAEMVGTTRSRVSHFMNKFRHLGLIDYSTDKITVRSELLTDVVLHE